MLPSFLTSLQSLKSKLMAAGLVAALLVSVAAVGYGKVEAHRADIAQQHATKLALDSSNVVAAAAPTVRIDSAPTIRAVLGDSLAAYQRQVVQVKQQRDSLDHALGLERIALDAMTVHVDSLQRSTVAVVSADTADRVRRARFDVRQPPYMVTAQVALPPAPDTAHLDLRVALDPIPVIAHLSCAPPNADGIRAAAIEATAPTWAAITFTHVEQSPDLCASPALTQASGRSLFKWTPIVVGAGYVARDAEHRGVGVFIGTAFALGGT